MQCTELMQQNEPAEAALSGQDHTFAKAAQHKGKHFTQVQYVSSEEDSPPPATYLLELAAWVWFRELRVY